MVKPEPAVRVRGSVLVERGLVVNVRITGRRKVYGRDELEVSRVSGDGRAWVRADRVMAPYLKADRA
jgi:hypothetical protein